MRDSLLGTLLLLALAGTAAGCGSNASSGLTTGSLFGSGKTAEAAAPPPPRTVSPSERATEVAATTARAQRCGFYFEPDALKASFLQTEQISGTPPDQIQKITKDYDTTRAALARVIAQDDGYCTEGRTREIKASLSRQLAGDFNPPAGKRVAESPGFLGDINQGKGREVFVPGEVFNPNRKGVTRREE